jgi:hypothetical protein
MFGAGFRDVSTNQSFADKRNAGASVGRTFKDGSRVPGAKKTIAKKGMDKGGGIAEEERKQKDTDRVAWMEERDLIFWPEDREVFVHDMETQHDVEAYIQMDEWKRLGYEMTGDNTCANWYLSSPVYIKRALEVCTKEPTLVQTYHGTGSRTTYHGVQFFKHVDGSIVLLRGDGIKCKCGTWHPRRI